MTIKDVRNLIKNLSDDDSNDEFTKKANFLIHVIKIMMMSKTGEEKDILIPEKLAPWAKKNGFVVESKQTNTIKVKI